MLFHDTHGEIILLQNCTFKISLQPIKCEEKAFVVHKVVSEIISKLCLGFSLPHGVIAHVILYQQSKKSFYVFTRESDHKFLSNVIAFPFYTFIFIK